MSHEKFHMKIGEILLVTVDASAVTLNRVDSPKHTVFETSGKLSGKKEFFVFTVFTI